MPAESAPGFTAVILAAQRNGRLDPMAAEAGVTHKCLVPILGRPLIYYVVEALVSVSGLQAIRICIEEQAFVAVGAALDVLGDLGVKTEFVASAPTITESAYASAQGLSGPIVVTTGDNVNLTPGAIERLLQAVREGAEGVFAMARREAVLAAHPEGQRRFYEFADGGYSNCNAYAVADPSILRGAEVFREGGQFAKHPARLLRIVGLFNILLLRFRLVSLKHAMKRLSRRLGFRLEAVVLEDGAHAVDVDNPRTYRIAETILRGKLGLAS